LWVNGSGRIRDNHCRTSGPLATESYWRLAFETVDTGSDANYAFDAFFVGDGKSAFGTVPEFSPQVICYCHPRRFGATRMNELDGFNNRCRQVSCRDGFSN